MKKVFLTLACVAFVALIATSCNKSCTCKNYSNGKEVSSVVVSDNMDKDQCKALTNYGLISDGYGRKCK